MKKILSIFLLITATLCSTSCNKNNHISSTSILDSDYDGLYDCIDPTPFDNKSGFLVKENGDDYSNEIIVSMDYRNFIFDETPTYNKDIGMMCGTLCFYSYAARRDLISIKTSKYVNYESNINPILVQFGFSNIKYITVDKKEVDENDVCGIFLGNHISLIDNKLYQVVVASIDGYPMNETWFSNMDIGSDSVGYTEINEDHPDWTNKKHHKGFDVTANRAYSLIVDYYESVKNNNAVDTLILVTGHSRGGAISNLLGKKLKDNNIKSLVYSFNNCQTTQENNPDILSSYTNVFSIISINDYISRFPFSFMGFNTYGKVLTYDLIANNDVYKKIFNREFEGNSVDTLDEIDNAAKTVMPSREKAYEYSAVDPEREDYLLCEDYNEALDTLEKVNSDIYYCYLDNYCKAAIIDNDNIEDKSEYPYKVQFYTKPISLLRFAAKLITVASSGGDVLDITLLLSKGFKFVSRYVETILEEGKFEIDINKFACPHMPATCIAGAIVAK